MNRQGGVVVGVDGSYGSARALRRALREAARAEADLTVVHAWQPLTWVEGLPGTVPRVVDAGDVRLRAERMLTEELAAARAELTDATSVRVVTQLREGDAGRVLTALSDDAVLLVLGRSGRGHLAGAFLGSAVRYALHHSRCPVMVVPDPGNPVLPWTRVVVGFDGSPQSTATVRWALATARREGCPLHVLHAWGAAGVPSQDPVESWEALTRQADAWLRTNAARALGETGEVCVTMASVHGSPTSTLLGEVAATDLVVVGARGRGGFRHLLLGSVAAQLAEHAPCALVVVR